MRTNKTIGFFAAGAATLVFGTTSAYAMCPVCTVAIGAGLGLSRWLGISDAVSGIWVGAFLFSVSMWTINWLRSKKKAFKGMIPATFLFYYGLTMIPLYFTGIMGHPFNKFLGIDKLLFGTIVGSLVFMAAALGYEEIKKRNGGKPWFPFQKVAMPVGLTLLASILMYFIDK